MRSAPFLFVGAGLGRRYLELPGWEGLLRRLAAETGKSYSYYAASANGDYPAIGSAIAEAFHEVWWNDDRFTESRASFAEIARTRESALKFEVAKYVDGKMADLKTDKLTKAELSLLGQAVIDGVITTNYDPLMQSIFPDFKTFVGQDELLFSAPLGVGEIYQIHGSSTKPDSIVLTTKDYGRFRDRNPYLAAKLLTIFIEHPVIFLGYSLTDPNITDLIGSIAAVLTTENVAKLQDHLLFVQWRPSATETTLVRTTMAINGQMIPVITVAVPDFLTVFEGLTNLKRKFPARLLRQLKEHVYDLVLRSDRQERLYVEDIEADTDASGVDVVMGVGIKDQLATTGYVGLSRRDLLDDVLRDSSRFIPSRVVHEALPSILRGSGFTPIYRYLRAEGFLDEEGRLRADVTFPSLTTRKVQGAKPFLPSKSYKKRGAKVVTATTTLVSMIEGGSVEDVLNCAGFLPPSRIDLSVLRSFLVEHASLFESTRSTDTSQWAKLVCLYDWYRFGAQVGVIDGSADGSK